jgi:general secretion pathway protein D
MKLMLLCGFLLVVTLAFGIKFYNELSSGEYAEKKTGFRSQKTILEEPVRPVVDKDLIRSDVKKENHFFYYKLKNISSDDLDAGFKTVGDVVYFDEDSDNYELTNVLAIIDHPKAHYYIKVYLAEVNINDNIESGFNFIFDSINESGNELFLQLITKNSFSFISDSFDLSGFINNSSNKVNVLSEPTLLVKQGCSAVVSAVSDTPVINSVKFDTETKNQVSNYSYKDIGLTLSLDVADFSTSSNCFIHLNQSISYISGYQHIDNNDLPVIANRTIESDVVLLEFETLILSSVRQNVKTSVESSVPVISRIPFFGRLFVNNKKINDSSDLVIMLELVNIN